MEGNDSSMCVTSSNMRDCHSGEPLIKMGIAKWKRGHSMRKLLRKWPIYISNCFPNVWIEMGITKWESNGLSSQIQSVCDAAPNFFPQHAMLYHKMNNAQAAQCYWFGYISKRFHSRYQIRFFTHMSKNSFDLFHSLEITRIWSGINWIILTIQVTLKTIFLAFWAFYLLSWMKNKKSSLNMQGWW